MITLEQVLKAYEYANSHPHKYLRGTTNWCAAVAHILNDQTPTDQHQVVPVVCVELVENKIHGGMHIVKWDNLGKLKEGIHKLYAEQPAPVADHPQCEECKGWGYHENHHEGGGTECGECGGSGNATVVMVMVMPDRMEVELFTTIDRGSKNYKAGYNAALAEVARLNEVKP